MKGCIKYAQGLHAADAVSHQQCNINYRTERNIPLAFQSHGSEGENKKGWPEEEDPLTAFFKVVSFLKENDKEQLIVGDLSQKCKSIWEVMSLTLKST